MKNLLAIQMLALGAPMLAMGDEVRRTQLGNNNAYCQDNEIAWLDWTLLSRHADVHRFVKLLVRARLLRDIPGREDGMTLNQLLKSSRIEWHGVRLHAPDWSEESHSLACTSWSMGDGLVLHAILNGYWEPLEFEVPPSEGSHPGWQRWIDTSLDSPEDIVDWADAPAFTRSTYVTQPRSIVVLFGRSTH